MHQHLSEDIYILFWAQTSNPIEKQHTRLTYIPSEPYSLVHKIVRNLPL